MSWIKRGVNTGVVLLPNSSVFLMRPSGRIQWVSAPVTKSKIARDLFSRWGASVAEIFGMALSLKSPETVFAARYPKTRNGNPKMLKKLRPGRVS